MKYLTFIILLSSCNTVVEPASLRTRRQDEECKADCAKSGWDLQSVTHNDNATCYCKEHQPAASDVSEFCYPLHREGTITKPPKPYRVKIEELK